MSIALPTFSELRANYPTMEQEALMSSIGGGVSSSYIRNTCVIRMSKAFNYLGAPPIPFDEWVIPSWKQKAKPTNFLEARPPVISAEKLHSIPATYPYINAFVTTFGQDQKRYCYRVDEFFAYLSHKYKKADVEMQLEFRQTMFNQDQLNQFRNKIYGKAGIICFKAKFPDDVPGSAPSGHFTLWDGATCAYKDYFIDPRTYAIYFWGCSV